jgi:hypothetical protein
MKVRVSGFLLLLPLLGLGHASHLRAQATNDWGVGSTNLDKLQYFWRAVERKEGPVTVLAFGDSLSTSCRCIATQFFNRLRTRFGTSGLGFEDGYYSMWEVFGGGATWQPPTSNWWTAHWTLPAGGSIVWTNRDGAAGTLVCDQVGVFWVAKPEGGLFTLSVSTNGQAWGEPAVCLDGYAPEPVGRYTNISVLRLRYLLRVDGVQGTNAILAPQFLDTTSSGMNVAFMSYGGASLEHIFSLSTNITYPILSALNPQLVIVHMKELADIGETGISNRLDDLEAMWRACVTNGDVIYVGTTLDARDETRVYTPREARLFKQAAVDNRRGYLDCMSPCRSYQWMVSQGYMYNACHPNNAGNAYLAGIAWKELGFFALRVDRRLELKTSSAGENHVEWPTVKGVTYELLSSADLSEWTSRQAVAGDGAVHSLTNSGDSLANQFFRLKLSGD